MLYLTGNSTNVIYTNVSSNKTLSNPTYLMSLTHAQTGKRWSFIPQNITSISGTPYNSRYDLFKFDISDSQPENLTGGTNAWYWQTPPGLVNQDSRFSGTGRNYLRVQPIVSNVFGLIRMIRDFSDSNEQITGGTMSLNGDVIPGSTVGIFDSAYSNSWQIQASVSVFNGFYSKSGLLEVSVETNSGNTYTQSYYVTSMSKANEIEPWTFYGYDSIGDLTIINLPITYIDTPSVNIDEIGEFSYSIREQANPVNLNPSLAMNQLEVGLGYITELFSDQYYDETEASEVYDPDLDYPSPTPTSTVTPTPTPSITPTSTVTPTPTLTPTPTGTLSLTPTPTPSSTPSSIDTDAAAYLADIISVGGSVDATMSAATDTLFTSLKSNSLYSKLGAFYPVLGGTAASHAINANGNSSFDLTFNNSFTHGYSGFAVSSSSSYAQTGYVPLTEHSGGTMSIGVMTNTLGVSNDKYAIGSYVAQNRFLSFDYFSSTEIVGKYLDNASGIPVIIPRAIGFVQLSSDGINKYMNINVDGSEYTASGLKDGTTLPNVELYIGALNLNGSSYSPQQGQICFAYIGDSLTSSELSTLSTIVDTFQTSLGRNTY